MLIVSHCRLFGLSGCVLYFVTLTGVVESEGRGGGEGEGSQSPFCEGDQTHKLRSSRVL